LNIHRQVAPLSLRAVIFLSKIVTRWQKMCLGVLRKINLLNARVGGLEKSRAFVFAPNFKI
jgi:hypothetical protein